MKSEAKKVKDMLKSIEKLSSDILESNDSKTREITERLKENKKRYSDVIASSYNQAFNINNH